MSANLLEVQAAVVAAVKADSALGALIGDRIYDERPDEIYAVDATDSISDVSAPTFSPCIVIDVNGVRPWDRMGPNGNLGEIVGIDLYVYSRDIGSVESKQIGGALVNLLHRSQLVLTSKEMAWGEHVASTFDLAPDARTHVGICEFRFYTHD